MPFPSIETFPGSGVFPGEEGTPEEFSELGDMLYAALAPTWTEPDEALGFPLRKFCDALMAQGQGLRDQVMEVGDRPGYGVLMIPDLCPPEALPYLAEIAGVDLNQLQKGFIVLQRNEVPNPNFEHDAIASVTPYGWEKEGLIHGTWETFEIGNGWSAPGKGSRALHMKMKHDGTTNIGGRTGIMQTFTAATMVPVRPGQTLTVQALLNIIKPCNEGFFIEVSYYKADANAFVSNEPSASRQFANETGEKTLNYQFLVPEKAAFARIAIINLGGTVANNVFEYWIDDIIATAEELPPTLPIEYIDGDQAGSSWTGLPGKSPSVEEREETEEEYVAKTRARIKELPNSARGTAASVKRAAEEHLIGDKTVILTERIGGNPWRVSVVTFLEETPNVQLTRETIENFLPAGIILEYEAAPATTWSIVRGEHPTWQDVKEKFATWNGVRDNLLGT